MIDAADGRIPDFGVEFAASCCKEVTMDNQTRGRRAFLKQMTALGAAGVPGITALQPRPVYSADL